MVAQHGKCGKINKNKSMYIKSAPCHCWPSPPTELQEPFSCWFVLFAHRSPHTVMWYKVICSWQIQPGAGWRPMRGWAEVRPELGHSSGDARVDSGLTKAVQSPVHLFPSNPLWAEQVVPRQASEWEKNSNMFWRALKEFYFLHSLQATAVLICLSIHFLFAGTFTLYLAHFKRTTSLYRQKITQ